MPTLGENIKAARKALHMSQDALAEAIGANRVTISKYENGGYLPSVPALERLADALQTTPEALSGRTEIKKEAVPLDGLDDRLVEMLVSLSPDQVQRVLDFVAGLKASDKA